MKIIIAGDFYIGDQYRNKKLIDKTVENLFFQADYRIINLEAPLITAKPENRILKTGPHLRMSDQTAITYLKQFNIDVVTMSNNHILDYGTEGVLNTFNTLRHHNISYVGAGMNLKDAAKQLTLEQDGMKIAVLNFCESEWSIAEEGKPGANPMGIIDNANQIIRAKQTHHKVICLVHGGHEYYNLPSPRMQKQYRFYAEQGADIVIGHHTHCISGNEVYKGAPIYYSLGNFLFTRKNKNEEWYTGLVLEVDLLNDKIKHHLHPVKQRKEDFNLSLLTGNDKKQVLDRVAGFSKIIQEENQLNNYWKKYVEEQSEMYLNYWSPLSFVNNRYLRAILKKLGGNMLNKRGLSLYLNLMRCEAHRDISLEVIENYLDGK